jgi:hypothetical protein
MQEGALAWSLRVRSKACMAAAKAAEANMH